jgi:hypothetical protein
LHFVVGLGGGFVGGARVGVGALHHRLEGGGVEGDDFVHVLGTGDRLGVGGGLLDVLAGGAEAELREALEVHQRQLGEMGDLVDGSLVGAANWSILNMVVSLKGSGAAWSGFAALHKTHFRPFIAPVKGVGLFFWCAAACICGSATKSTT